MIRALAAFAATLAATSVLAQDYAVRKDAQALRGAVVTLFRLNDVLEDKPAPGDDQFHGLRILCKVQLDSRHTDVLLKLIAGMAARQEDMLKKPGVPGGVPGCIGWGFGLRFESKGKYLDGFACLHCGWMFGADRSGMVSSLTYVFSKSEQAEFDEFFQQVLPCFHGVN